MNVVFKLLVTIFITIMSGSIIAQELENPREELTEKDWILMKLIMNGEEMPFLPNSEVTQSTFLVESNEYLTASAISFCVSYIGFSMILDGNNEFYADYYPQLAKNNDSWACELPENTEYENIYLYDFWNNPDVAITNTDLYPFHFLYTISQWEEFEELIVTNDNGDQAYFGNAALSTQQNLFSEVKLYPNPMNDLLFVDQLPEKSKMEIYDVNGKLLISQTLTMENAQIEVSSLSKGIYFYRLSNTANQFKTGKLIKN